MSACQHSELQFNSGDYYLTCHECGARWGRISGRGDPAQPEYGTNAKGEPIGCMPEVANQGFHDPAQFRQRKPL